MKLSADEYCVYIPDDLRTKRNLIPQFYRLRKVRLVNHNYFTCSCGLSSRMELPCRHIMSIGGGYTIEMFALRWLI